MTPSVRVHLKNINADDDIVMKHSDKCKSFVLLSKEDNVEKALRIEDSYQKVNKNPTSDLEDITRGLMRSTLTVKIPQDHLKRLLPQHARTTDPYVLEVG